MTFKKVTDKVLELWKEKSFKGEPSLLDKPFAVSTNIFYDSLELKEKHKNMKKLHVSNIEQVECEFIHNFTIGASVHVQDSLNKSVYEHRGETGLFIIEFTENQKVAGHAIYAAYLAGDLAELNDMLLIDKELLVKFKYALEAKKVKAAKPKPGIYKAFLNNGMLVYNDIKDIAKQEGFTIHEKKQVIIEDIDIFFDKLPMYIENDENGQYKVMVAGEPGTGKSSLLMELANKYKETHNVCFFTDLGALAAHCARVSKENVPSICFLEDCEQQFERAGGDVLNWLNGFNQPVSKSGIYIIFTTNHPKMIEDRIKKRPGRIDEIFIIGALKGLFAWECAKRYMSRYLPEGFNYEPFREDNTFSELTGAQISMLANAMLKVALKKAETTEDIPKIINPKFANEQILALADKYKEIENIEADSLRTRLKARGIGY
jgi:hypothetical protein